MSLPTVDSCSLPHVHRCLEPDGRKGAGEARTALRDRVEDESGDYWICASCGNRITSPSAHTTVNGSHQHTFANPHGFVYRFGCFLTAPGCRGWGEESTQFAWFSGYAWQVEICAQCGVHLGWGFRSERRHFHGLLVDGLVMERDTPDTAPNN